MYKIDIQEVIDYCKCPMYYFFKYKSSECKTEYVSTIEKYDKDIHRVIYYSFSRAQEGLGIRVEDIKASWGKAWVKDKRKSGIMFTDTLSNKDTYNERRKKGIDSLISFQKKFSKNPGYPIIINQPFEVSINKKINLTGRFELIREVEDELNNKYIEVCTFKTDEHTNSKVNREHDLNLAASALASKEYIDADNIKYMIYHVDKKSMTIHDDSRIMESAFKKSVVNIFKAIHNDLFYIAPSDKCFTCVYKEICGNNDNIIKLVDKETK